MLQSSSRLFSFLSFFFTDFSFFFCFFFFSSFRFFFFSPFLSCFLSFLDTFTVTAVLLYKSSHQGLKAPSVPNPIPLESCFCSAISADVRPSSSFPSPFPLKNCKNTIHFCLKLTRTSPSFSSSPRRNQKSS